RPAAPPTREKGWRAAPIAGADPAPSLLSVTRDGAGPHVAIGVGLDDRALPGPPTPGAGRRAILAQEIRNARGGQYTFTVRASGGGERREAFERFFPGLLTCRLVLFRYADPSKDPTKVQELASLPFVPQFAD